MTQRCLWFSFIYIDKYDPQSQPITPTIPTSILYLIILSSPMAKTPLILEKWVVLIGRPCNSSMDLTIFQHIFFCLSSHQEKKILAQKIFTYSKFFKQKKFLGKNVYFLVFSYVQRNLPKSIFDIWLVRKTKKTFYIFFI